MRGKSEQTGVEVGQTNLRLEIKIWFGLVWFGLFSLLVFFLKFPFLCLSCIIANFQQANLIFIFTPSGSSYYVAEEWNLFKIGLTQIEEIETN